MKKSILLFAITFMCMLSMRAQQIPLYSQLYFMRMLYNPALTGYNGETNLYGFYRNQWTGMPGHPVTAGAVGEASLWKDRSGVGFHVISDNTDIIHRVNAQGYYAQKIHIAKDHIISLGFSAGIMEAHVDFNNAVTPDGFDPHLLSNGKSGIAFDMNVGLAYQWKKLTVGFSVPQVINTKARIINQLNEAGYSNKRQFVGSVSYEISIAKEKFNIEPSVLVKSSMTLPVQVDANIMANYKRIVYLGVGYRLDYGVSMMAAMRISKTVTLGYAYEYPIIKNLKYGDTKGTHEVILGVNFTHMIKKAKDVQKEMHKMDSVLATNAEVKKQLDSLQAQVDSIKADVDTAKQNIGTLKENVGSVKQNVDSIQQHLDDVQKQTIEQQEKQKQLQQHLDSFETMAKEYKQHIKDKPAKNFPSKVDKTTKAGKGDIFRLNKVEFDRNSSYLKDESYGELDKLMKFLEMNPNTQIRVMGHTDYIASDEYNQWLSERRAKRVYDYLLEKGVSADRMTYIGFGKKIPIADNNTDEGRALNRRVEIEITK